MNITVEVFTVCGFHPTEGTFSYSAYQSFASYAAADAWRKEQSHPHWSHTDIISHKIEASELGASSRIGELVWWKTFGKQTCFGWLKEWDNGTAIMRMNMNSFAVRAN